MKNLLVRLTGLIVLFLLSTIDIYAQCAMCRGSVESSIGNGKNNVAFGLNTGIMYLFAIPYIIVAVLVYLWFKNSKLERAKREMLQSDY
jgi:uncharacterized oligopeptide transporter (OPT) family protein